MKKTSRILAVLLALAMLFSLSALASGEPSGSPSEETPTEKMVALESTADMNPSSYATLDAVSTRPQDEGHIFVGLDIVDGQLTDESNWGAQDFNDITLANAVVGAGFTAVHASGEMSGVTVSGGDLVLVNGKDDSQGVHASDFTGAGAAFVAADSAKLTIRDVNVITDGFVRAFLVVDHGATAWVENADVVTYGANPLTDAYDGYVNSAATSKMLSPPWVLGIQGGIRTVNILDTEATLVLVDSRLAAGGWGVVSTDGCTNPKIYFIDSDLRILSEAEGGMSAGEALYGYDEGVYGSGYGSYIIGNVDEQYYGTHISGATFGAIAREGSAVYASSNGAIDVTSAKGEALGTVQGRGDVTTIDTVIGVMSHSSEDVSIDYTDGTIVNTAAETVLYRSSGHGNFTFDNAVLNPGNGVILQMIDDDDSTVGMGDFSTMGFNTALIEAPGMPSANGSLTGPTSYNEEVNAVFKNGYYCGNLYNGTGYYGQAGDVLNVTVGPNAYLEGAVSLTETFHGVPYSPEALAFAQNEAGVEYVLLDADYKVTANQAEAAFIQFTQFTIDQYYMLCRMLNHVYNNGYSGANVTVEAGSQWTITEPGVISSLKVEGTVKGGLYVNEDGSLTVFPYDYIIPAGVYGTAVEANVAAARGMGNAGGSTEPSGTNPGGASGEASSAEPAAPASQEPASAGYTADYAGWIQYLKDYVSAVPAAQEHLDEFFAAIDAGSFDVFPGDMLFQDTFWGYTASTYDEFIAAGGQVTIPDFDPGLSAD